VYDLIDLPDYPDFPEPPANDKIHGRKNGEWVEITGGDGGDGDCDCSGDGVDSGGWIIVGGGHVMIDHVPTLQSEVDTFPLNAEVLVYDKNSPHTVS